MGNRWAVKYYPSPDAAWFVTRWDGELAYWEFQGHFPTHAEALAYADRQARTVTVELPRVKSVTEIPTPYDFRHEESIKVRAATRSIEYTAQETRSTMSLHPDELEPLALTLLALAKGQA